MKKGLSIKTMAVGLLLSSMVACTGNKTSDATCCNGEGECTEQSKCDKNSNCKTNKEMTYSKKYTNADFYKDGKFDQAVAIEAMKDMFKFYDVPFTELMAKDMWVTDFGLGDFENVGMGGIFWINDAEHGYFAHAIYLLPGQIDVYKRQVYYRSERCDDKRVKCRSHPEGDRDTVVYGHIPGDS